MHPPSTVQLHRLRSVGQRLLQLGVRARGKAAGCRHEADSKTCHSKLEIQGFRVFYNKSGSKNTQSPTCYNPRIFPNLSQCQSLFSVRYVYIYLTPTFCITWTPSPVAAWLFLFQNAFQRKNRSIPIRDRGALIEPEVMRRRPSSTPRPPRSASFSWALISSLALTESSQRTHVSLGCTDGYPEEGH